MVALSRRLTEPTRRNGTATSFPPDWRVIATVARGFVRTVGRIEITGRFPDELRGRSVLVAANHIGMFDPFVLVAVSAKLGVPLRFMLTAGLLDAPVIGLFLRRAGHVRVGRGKSNVVEAFERAVERLREAKIPLLVYPEGRVSHDPGLWPERGKTGVARMALAGNVPVVTISQWGAHEAVYWGTETVTKPAHFGEQVDLSDLSADRPGDAMRAHKRIMQAITDGLVPLRQDELDRPRFHDPTRPTDAVSPWRPAP
jgi:1-acyl-sn-glycerol-3-phosphate acyltransferase